MADMIHINRKDKLLSNLVNQLLYQKSLYNISDELILFLFRHFNLLIKQLPNEVMSEVFQSAHLYLHKSQYEQLKQLYETYEEEKEIVNFFDIDLDEDQLSDDGAIEEITVEGIAPDFKKRSVSLFSHYDSNSEIKAIVGSSRSAFNTPVHYITPNIQTKKLDQSPNRIADLEEEREIITKLTF